MIDLAHLEALAGPLPKGQRIRNILDDARNTQTGRLHINPRQAVDGLEDALDEAYSVIKQLAKDVTSWRKTAITMQRGCIEQRQRAEKAETEARKWEWVAREAARTPDDKCESPDILITELLARHDVEHGGKT